MKYSVLAGLFAAALIGQSASAAVVPERYTFTYVTPATADFSGSTFTYTNSFYLTDDPVSVATSIGFQPVATDIRLYTEGGATVNGVTELLLPDGTPTVNVTIAGPGKVPGGDNQLFGFDYNGVASGTAGNSFLTFGEIGGRYALTFTGGGFGLVDTTGIFHSVVVIDGDWSNALSHTAATFGAGYTLENDFTYDSVSNKTTFRITTTDYEGIDPGISFSLLGDVVPGVPEPATWASMILGLFGIGFTMRRRQAATALA